MPYIYTTLDNKNMHTTTVLSSDLLEFLPSTAYLSSVFSTKSVNSGKWYFEVVFNTQLILGLAYNSTELGVNLLVDANTQNGFFIKSDGQIWGGGVNTYGNNTNIGASLLNKTIGVQLDFDSGKITYIVDNVKYSPYSNLTFKDNIYVYLGKEGGTASGKINFGQNPFVYGLEEGLIPFGKTGEGLIVKNPITNNLYSLAEKTLITLPDASDKNMILFGIEVGKEIRLDEEFDKINYPVESGLKNTVKTMVKPLSIKFE